MRRAMQSVLIGLLTGGILSPASADEPKKPAEKSESQLVGTWKLISAKYGGKEATFPEGTTRLKHVTPTHFMWASYDKDGKVGVAFGGSYTATESKYEELGEFGTENVLELKGKPHSFEWKIEGNKWYHNGKLASGLSVEEVWERVDKK